MAAIDTLIAQIEDEKLRERLRREVDALLENKEFGLVFQDHLPELVPMYSEKVRKGATVAIRDDELTNMWDVRKIVGQAAVCVNRKTKEERHIPKNDLVVVLEFGEPIFPSLVPVDKVKNGADDAPWHTLIEADNYHALQLLEYLYAGQVDCIYIDPPYNTGARDWKYNNDYVDGNDAWRHSKWLSMMRRRLIIAWRLLKSNGMLCITIDDYEAHRLRSLIEQTFGTDSVIGQIVIRSNPSGRSTVSGLSVAHEYALLVSKGSSGKLTRFPRSAEQWGRFKETDEEGAFEWRNFRKDGGATTYRNARPKQYYPIFVKGDIIRIPEMSWNTTAREWDIVTKQEKDEIVLWPIDDKGNERVWSFSPSTAKIRSNELIVRRSRTEVDIARKYRPSEAGVLPRTWWDKREYSAREYGSAAVKAIFGESQIFPFAKSPYATKDCLWMIGADNPDSIVVDFYSGSGTTLEAVLSMNAVDGGRRKCILVTNNETSAEKAEILLQRGLQPGDKDWECHGICRSVTWPRSKFRILGKRDDGTTLTGEYLTGKTVEREKARSFTHIGFVESASLTKAKKKQIIALIDGLPQTLVADPCPYIVSEEHSASILFDADSAEQWLEALDGQDHITSFYIVTERKTDFDALKRRVNDLLGPQIIVEEEKRPMSEGFAANLEYFKLDFLDKNNVALGRQFREILPLLWLRAGAIGERPELPKRMDIPPWLIPEKNLFAVLVDETRYSEFILELEKRSDITHVFIITDSEDSFHEMAENISVANVIQLYRDYLENFMINKGDKE